MYTVKEETKVGQQCAFWAHIIRAHGMANKDAAKLAAVLTD